MKPQSKAVEQQGLRSAASKCSLTPLFAIIIALLGAGCQRSSEAPGVPTPAPTVRRIFETQEAIMFAGGPGLVDHMDLLIMNPDGSDVGCAICGGGLRPIRTAPAWSPDGRAVAWATTFLGTHRPTYSSIDVMFDDGHTVNLVLGPDEYGDPTWAPDGSEIAFTYTRRIGDDPDDPGRSFWADPQICVVPVRPTGTPIPLGQMRCLTSEGRNVYPHWSPDGSWIAFAYTAGGDRDARSDIYIIKSDGTEKTNLTNTPERGEGEPRWSPNGKQIAYARRDPEQDQPDVWVMDADGSNQVNLTPGGEDGTEPAWSPDGKKIVFVTTRTSRPDQPWCEGGCLGYNEIYVMDADGSNPVNITNEPQTYSEQPDWRGGPGGGSMLPWIVGAGSAALVIAASAWAIRRRSRLT